MDTENRNADNIEALAASIVGQATRINVAIREQLANIRHFDSRRGWELYGAKSCAQWLSRTIGLGASAARERVRIAHALASLPSIDDALAAGEISFSKVRAMTRVATPETEVMLLSVAKRATGAQLERFCRALRKSGSSTRAWQDRFVRRRSVADSGMVRIEIQLDSDEAATVWAALLAGARGAAATRDDASTPESASGLADALHRFAEQLLADQVFSGESAVDAVDLQIDAEPVGESAPHEGEARHPTDAHRRRDDGGEPDTCCLGTECEEEATNRNDADRPLCDTSHECSLNGGGSAERDTDPSFTLDVRQVQIGGPQSAHNRRVPDCGMASSSPPEEGAGPRATTSERGDPPSARG